MANTQSAKKRARQTIRRTIRNEAVRNSVKTAIRKAREAIDSQNGTSLETLKATVSVIAKAGNKGVLHHRAVARKVSRLMSRAAKIAKAPAAPVAAAKATKSKAKTTARKTK
jgi:small subunit ribosomal protein S20